MVHIYVNINMYYILKLASHSLFQDNNWTTKQALYHMYTIGSSTVHLMDNLFNPAKWRTSDSTRTCCYQQNKILRRNWKPRHLPYFFQDVCGKPLVPTISSWFNDSFWYHFHQAHSATISTSATIIAEVEPNMDHTLLQQCLGVKAKIMVIMYFKYDLKHMNH